MSKFSPRCLVAVLALLATLTLLPAAARADSSDAPPPGSGGGDAGSPGSATGDAGAILDPHG